MSIGFYKKEITLRQLTPMVHFQGDQEGACLRAPEVKPKLDKFALGWLARQGVDKNRLPAGWANEDGKGWTSLRYQLRFRAEGENCWPADKPAHPFLYFAGSIGSEAKGVFYPDGVTVTVLDLLKTRLETPVKLPNGGESGCLGEIIHALLPAFFALHCFGARSNKGFGSFEVAGEEVDVETLDRLKPEGVVSIYQLESDLRTYGPEDRLDDVYVLSALMKGGVTRPAYVKGAIQKFSIGKGVGTEKAYLKQKVFTKDDLEWYRDTVCQGKGRTTQGSYERYWFIRAMLGLVDGYAYGVGKDKKRVFGVKAVQEEIERFGNPVHFHPFTGGLRILVHEIPEVMYGAAFQFENESQPDAGYIISTPNRDEFDLDGFVRDFLRPLAGGVLPEDWDRLSTGEIRVNAGRKDREGVYHPGKYKRTLQIEQTLRKLRLTYGGEA